MPIFGNKKEKDVIASMFLTAAIVMIFTQMTGVVATIIDGIVTSRFLGSDQYSAVALLGPLVNIVLLFASFVSIGGQIVCSNKVGTGERDEANAVFTFSLLFGILVAAAFVIFSVISPGTLLQICGVSHKGRPELYEHMLDYLHGYMIGIPAVIMVQILSPFMVMDNGKQLVSLSATVLCLSDIAGDFINALVIRGGVFGMGVATSIAMWLQLLVLLVHFVKKEGYFRLSLKSLKGTHIRDIGQNGLISFVKKLATILRDILTNRINLVVAVSTAAVAAKGMQADLNMLMFCISIGIGRTLLTMSSMYYGAEDLDGLKRAYKYAMLLCIRLLAVVGVILFIAAPLVSRIYTSDPEVTALSVFSIRCMALGLSLDGRQSGPGRPERSLPGLPAGHTEPEARQHHVLCRALLPPRGDGLDHGHGLRVKGNHGLHGGRQDHPLPSGLRHRLRALQGPSQEAGGHHVPAGGLRREGGGQYLRPYFHYGGCGERERARP